MTYVCIEVLDVNIIGEGFLSCHQGAKFELAYAFDSRTSSMHWFGQVFNALNQFNLIHLAGRFKLETYPKTSGTLFR